MNASVKIEHLGHQGDGVGTIDGRAVFVPFALPQEQVETSGNGARRQIVSIQSPSPDRVEPFCDLFGTCGGCQLQHLKHDAYVAWKRSLLIDAFAREEITIQPQPMRTYERQSRRRAVLTAKRSNGALIMGFSERGSHNLVDVSTCPILEPVLDNVLSSVKALVETVAPKKGDLRINLLKCGNGIDLALTFNGRVENKLILELISNSASKDFIRLSLNGEIVFESQRPLLGAGLATLSPAPNAFVQAVQVAEEGMAELVVGHLKSCKKVADLFSGHGTFALRLAQNSLVYAAESNAPALAALDRAWRETGGKLKTTTHEKRDLFRRPMSAAELKKFDGAVFDPPRAGAEAQARELAKSNVKKIAAVSCNPQTLARDLKVLTAAGFSIVSVTPIDQFAFTPHLETVVLMER